MAGPSQGRFIHTSGRSQSPHQAPLKGAQADCCSADASGRASPSLRRQQSNNFLILIVGLSHLDCRAAVAITSAGSLILVRQYRHAVSEFLLELTGGAVDAEDPDLEQAASRELEEETGSTARRWELVTSLYPNPATHTNRVHFFLARDCECTHPQKLDVGEGELTVELVEIPFVLDGLRTRMLGQAMHVAGVLLGLAVAGRLNITAT
jgi:8-oxo-dGTP pyrophosphatase MutT (NUDIX family)